MKILVYPAMMEIGGSQLNAIELAAEMTREGHEVVMYAPTGELNEVAAAQGVEVVHSPCEERWPTAASLRGLMRLVRQRGIEIVHAYEWGPSVEAALGPYALLGIPMITTVLSMDVPDLIPLQPPLVVGTAELAAEQSGIRTTHLAEPWIDTEANAPGATDRRSARARFGLAESDTVLTVVCRLTSALEKADGVLAAMTAVHRRNAEGTTQERHRLLVVGDGERLAEIRSRAAELNAAAGFDETVVVGPLLDPRDAYDCADVIVGMGSSALKGLSFAKPLIVQGTGGFWRAFTADTVAVFDHQGFFGHDELDADGAAASLLAQLDIIAQLDRGSRAELGGYGRRYIESRFSLRAAASAHLDYYQAAIAAHPTVATRAAAGIRTAKEAAKLNLALRRHRRVERVPVAAVVAEPERFAAQPPIRAEVHR